MTNLKSKNIISWMLFFLTMCAFMFIYFIPSLAATNNISSVSIQIMEEKVDPGEVYPAKIYANGSSYEVDDVSVSKDYDDWTPGKTITFSITLIPTEGYKFSKSDTNFYVSNGEIASKSVVNGKASLKINYIPKVTLSAPEDIYYEDEYLITWDKVEYATAYKVTLYKDGYYYKSENVTKNEFDLSPYATDEDAEITFTVAATANTSKQSAYLKTSEAVGLDEGVTASDNTSYGSFVGNGPDMKFKGVDGYYITGWHQINGSWYYFKSDEKAAYEEWQNVNGLWYYFNNYNIMQTGWLRLNNTWYYLNTNGSMYTGWLQAGPGEGWYYLDTETGAMLTGTTTPDGYYVDNDGRWIS